jgi:hypothetical protein
MRRPKDKLIAGMDLHSNNVVIGVINQDGMQQATRILGVSRQTNMQRVKRGELSVVHVSRGKQKGLRIRVLDNQPQLFNPSSAAKV